MRERVDSQDGEQDGGREGARDVELVLASEKLGVPEGGGPN